MTHVSKHKLKDKDFEMLYTKMHSIIAVLNKQTSENFFNELLSPAEKIMVTKRLSAIIMFREGCSAYRVSHVLLMSPSTTERIKLKFEIGKFKNIVKLLEKERRVSEAFWKELELILRGGLPPMGRGRWKNALK